MNINTAVSANAVARVLGIETSYTDLRGNNVVNLPQRIAVIGQGNDDRVYSTDKRQIFSAAEAGNIYGFGSLIHLAALELLPSNGNGVGTIPVTVYPVAEAALAVSAQGDITPVDITRRDEVEAYRVQVNGDFSEVFQVVESNTATEIAVAISAAINANLNLPVRAVANAGVVELTAKWAGFSGNDIEVSIIALTDSDTTFAVTQPTGGAGDPDVNPALDMFGNVWETLVLNCFGSVETAGTRMTDFAAFGESRWAPLVRKPFVAFTGVNKVTYTEVLNSLGGTTRNDRVNSFLSAPGAAELPVQIAAAALVKIAVLALNNPPHDYGGRKLTSLTAGQDADQFDGILRETAVLEGISTTQVKDSTIVLSDTLTRYAPSGEANPPYRYVVDIIKLMNVIFNIDLIFASEEWDGAPLIPDNQPTVNRSAKKPKAAVAALASLTDSLGLEAIISDPASAKRTIVAEIDDTNAKRLNVCVTYQLSGNTNIISVGFKFGFFFGTQALVGQDRVQGLPSATVPPAI